MIWNCEGKKKKKIPCAIQKTRSAQNLWSDFIFVFFFQLVSLFLWPADFHSSVFIYLFIYLFSPSFFSVTKKKRKALWCFAYCVTCVWRRTRTKATAAEAHEAQKFFYFSILTKRNRRRAAEETSHSQPKIGVHKNPLIFSAISSLLKLLPRFWCAGDDDDGLKSFFSLIIADCNSCGKLNVKDFFSFRFRPLLLCVSFIKEDCCIVKLVNQVGGFLLFLSFLEINVPWWNNTKQKSGSL